MPSRDDFTVARRHAVAVEGRTAEAAFDMRPLAELNEFRHHPLAQVVEQEGRFAVERTAAGGMHQAAEQAGGQRRFEQHRKLAGLDLAPTQAGDGALGGGTADLLRIVELAGVAMVVYQSSRCMASCSPAMTEHEM
jgi:hypothetical protein